MRQSVIAYIGLGANLGDAQLAVLAAMDAIADLDGVALLRRSSLYGSAPVDAGGADYVNAVVEIQTRLKALELLTGLQQLERQAGRERNYHNAPRTLDLDLLLFGKEHIAHPDLVVPHPRMWQRAFVLHPLAELAPKRVSEAELKAVRHQSVWRLEQDAVVGAGPRACPDPRAATGGRPYMHHIESHPLEQDASKGA
jgi:2-amino-4-hydroxy-6-hydroxymethyldihydropteridine diphosphokinase